MNRSILIVICDFLLVSLLVFSTPDPSRVLEQGAETVTQPAVSTNAPSGGKDLEAVMRVALNEERQKREQLVGELQRSRQTAAQQQARLSESETRVQNFQQELQSREQQARQLQQQQGTLQQQFATSQMNVEALDRQLRASSTEAAVSKEKLATLQADAQQQAKQAAALQQRLAELEKANQAALAEKARLAGQLQLAELEKRHAAEQAAQMQQQVRIEREEKARLEQQATKLAEGVKVLANKSGELAQEIRENRPLASNTIFNEFLTNQVEAQFTATRPGFFGGEAKRQRNTKTILVTNGTNVFAFCHLQETPLTFANPATDWEGLTWSLRHSTREVPLQSMSFTWPDPRVVFAPVSKTDADRLGARVYRTSSDPYKFQDAVLVGAREGYYGECGFQIDPKTPGYVKLDRNVLKGLFGKFNPSRGDLVFSRTGELLGIMANNSYCMMLHRFDPSATVQLGPNVRAQRLGEILSRFYASVSGLPWALQ